MKFQKKRCESAGTREKSTINDIMDRLENSRTKQIITSRLTRKNEKKKECFWCCRRVSHKKKIKRHKSNALLISEKHGAGLDSARKMENHEESRKSKQKEKKEKRKRNARQVFKNNKLEI